MHNADTANASYRFVCFVHCFIFLLPNCQLFCSSWSNLLLSLMYPPIISVALLLSPFPPLSAPTMAFSGVLPPVVCCWRASLYNLFLLCVSCWWSAPRFMPVIVYIAFDLLYRSSSLFREFTTLFLFIWSLVPFVANRLADKANTSWRIERGTALNDQQTRLHDSRIVSEFASSNNLLSSFSFISLHWFSVLQRLELRNLCRRLRDCKRVNRQRTREVEADLCALQG